MRLSFGKRIIKRSVAMALAVTTITVPFSPFEESIVGSVAANAATDTSLDEYEDIASTYSIEGDVPDYTDYIAGCDSARPGDTITIDADTYSRFTSGTKDDAGNEVDSDPKTFTDYEGMEGTSIESTEEGLVEYDVNVATAGLYDLSIEYYPEAGNSSAIQRAFFIDGSLPFTQLANVEFTRVWENTITDKVTDKNGITVLSWEKDNQGNDLKPTMQEVPEWLTSYLYDSDGYITSKLSIYLTAGTHTITMVSIKEPMILRSMTLSNSAATLSYEQQKAQWDSQGAGDTSGQMIRIEAENASKTSSQMLYPTQDQSSPAVYPSSAKELLNNAIGGNSWRLVNQWIEWNFDVPEDGYYYVTLHARQNFVKGVYVSRKISIDGEVPFSELSDYGFSYEQNWRLDTLSDDEGNAYRIYLTKGTHTIRMQSVLGEFSQIISGVQECVTELNSIYRKVIRITGVSPDEYRDYQIEASIPGLNDELVTVRDSLTELIKELRAAAGKSDKETVLITMRDQLDELIADEERFTEVISDYKTNVRACGTWITSMLSQPLQLDTIYVYSPDEKVSVENSGFWSRLFYEFARLFYSFVVDYNQIGNVTETTADSKTITLWVGTGRDQANVIKALIDKSFTLDTGINVNVMLVDMSTLLQATLAGQGPDVAIQVGNDLPMNYGLRNAVVDLTQFDDLDSFVEENFNESAMVAFNFNGATYGLPETQTFPMMFYRKDILKELSLEVPDTWDDVKVAMTVLAKNQMEVGMLPGENIFAMLLYQNGGKYYTDNADASALDSDEAVNAFKEYCEFYTDYKIDKSTNLEERFRTGEAPIIIADYTLYNNLAVSAPDIKGLWGFAPVPGTLESDGTVNRAVGSTGLACVMMSASDDKNSSWEFMKWWTGADTQLDYNNEMESLMGSAARVATANKIAFSELPWPNADKEALLKQFESVEGIPQVPGGYFSYRNVNNAFYRVTTNPDEVSPREELMDQVIYINSEINYKRKEFNLPLAKDAQ